MISVHQIAFYLGRFQLHWKELDIKTECRINLREGFPHNFFLKGSNYEARRNETKCSIKNPIDRSDEIQAESKCDRNSYHYGPFLFPKALLKEWFFVGLTGFTHTHTCACCEVCKF